MSLEHRFKEAFDDLTAPEQLKRRTLAAIEERRGVQDPRVARDAEGAVPANDAKGAQSARSRKRSPRKAWYAYALPMAACLVAAAIGIGAFALSGSPGDPPNVNGMDAVLESEGEASIVMPAPTPAAYVAIDVNPSLELTLDEQDTVIAAEARNDDAQAVLATIDLAGLPYEAALSALFASEAMAPYLSEDAIVEISVTAQDDAVARTLMTQSDQALAQLSCSGSCHQVDDATRTAAHDAGMGVGKYRVATELIELDPAVTMDECSHMSMRQLRDAVDHCHASAAAAGNDGSATGGHHGSGSGHHSGR